MKDLNTVEQQVRDVVSYLWSREAIDYASLLAEGEDVENHIFVSLMQVSNVLNGMSTDPETWARKQFKRLFE